MRIQMLRDRDDSGVTAVEYGLMIALAVAAIVAAFGPLNNAIVNLFQDVANAIGQATP